MTSINYKDLEDAFDFVSASAMFDSHARVSRESGKIFWASSEIQDDLPDLPADFDDPDKYVDIPAKNDLDLGKALVLRFAAGELPDRYEEVEAIFRRRGAYGRFKDLLASQGKLDAWHQFETEAVKQELCEWAALEGFTVSFAGSPEP